MLNKEKETPSAHPNSFSEQVDKSSMLLYNYDSIENIFVYRRTL
jgi:hypothetical protein